MLGTEHSAWHVAGIQYRLTISLHIIITVKPYTIYGKKAAYNIHK